MEDSLKKPILYSTLFHLLLLFFVYFIYRNFLVVRTPLLMDLTLIGQMSKGEGMGSPAPNPGEVSGQLPEAETDGDFSTPKKEPANPPVPSVMKPEVSVKRPLKPRKNPGRSSAESNLRNLRRSAPIGLDPRKDLPNEIKTTSGLGNTGTAGTPDGSSAIEGELAARNILKQVKPDYPEWAREKGIEAVVKFRLTVLPNGHLKLDDLQLEQTSGYMDLDQVVYKALLQWEFEPLGPQIPQVNQSGVIPFTFSLNNSPLP